MSYRPAVVLHLCAPNDTNGNPRRVFVTIDDDGLITGRYDEGYLGSSAVPQPYQKVPRHTIAVSGAEYARTVKFSPRAPK